MEHFRAHTTCCWIIVTHTYTHTHTQTNKQTNTLTPMNKFLRMWAFVTINVGSLRLVPINHNLTDSKTRWRLHSVDPTPTGLSSPGQDIIHSPVAIVMYGWWVLVYRLRRMPGSMENVANCVICVSEVVSIKHRFFFILSCFRADLTV